MVIGAWAYSKDICTTETCRSPNTLTIKISNPYSFDVDAEVKCDWNDEKQTFDYHERFVFPADQITNIQIPKAQKSCEIWPHVKLFE